MNWYLKQIFAQLTGLQNYLGSLQTTPDIMQYILSLDKDTAQFLTNEIRKTPTLTLDQIQSIQLPQKIDPYLPIEKRKAERAQPISQWVLVNYRKLRKGKIPPDNQMSLLNTMLNQEESITYWAFDGK